MENRHVELLIVGAGCAGLAAGIYAARSGMQALILERSIPGGQAAVTAQIENYPGLPPTDGITLMQNMAAQAKRFGAEILCREALSFDPQERSVVTDIGTIRANAVILAMGATPRKLGIPGETKFTGRGVSYCAACDGFFYRDREIIVVGGGNSAAEESLHLAQIGSGVRMLVRRNALRCDARLREKVIHHPKIRVCFGTELKELRGEDRIETMVLQKAVNGERTVENAENCGVFIFAGYEPATELLAGKLALDAGGYVVTDSMLQTSAPGVFAAGDLRQKQLRQVVTAAADGAEAAFQACKFCADMLS